VGSADLTLNMPNKGACLAILIYCRFCSRPQFIILFVPSDAPLSGCMKTAPCFLVRLKMVDCLAFKQEGVGGKTFGATQKYTADNAQCAADNARSVDWRTRSIRVSYEKKQVEITRPSRPL
jgi:hypothetical protein